MVDDKTGKTIDIVEDRRLTNLIKYFSYYSHKARIMICKNLLHMKKASAN